MKRKIEVLADPFLIISIILLLANDFILKNYYRNFFTGKLSDFAGLFAFTFFLLALFPERKKILSVLTITFFIFWKSSLSQPLIDIWNSMSFYHIGRTIDYTDLIALPIVWIAYKYYVHERKMMLKKYMAVPVSLLALFSFCATSYLHVYQLDKSYEISLPKEEVVRRLNDICRNCENFTPLSSQSERADTTFVNYDSDTVSYSVTGYRYYNDTIWSYDKSGKKTGIDTVYNYKYIDKDTMYLSPAGFFIMKFDIKEYLKLSPEQYCGCVEVHCRLKGSGNKSVLTVHTIDAGPCTYIKPGDKGKGQLIDAFDQLIENKLKNP